MAEYITESQKQVPIAYDVGVAVAGGGIGGVFAALASARNGAKTVIIDRFGALGGNIGPGMISGGGFHGPPDAAIFGGFTGLPREFLERYVELGGAVFPRPSDRPIEPPFREPQYFRDSSIASYLSFKMLKEAGVQFMLSSYVADPIVEKGKVLGVFVENKSGRQAVMAKVTVDATGEADLARKAGAPIIYPKADYSEMDRPHSPTGMGLFFALGNVNWERYEKYKKSVKVLDEDIEWIKGIVGDVIPESSLRRVPLVSLQRKAWESGDYRFFHEMDGLGYVVCGELHPYSTSFYRDKGSFYSTGIACTQLVAGLGKNLKLIEEVNAADSAHISRIEVEVRTYIFETAQFWKNKSDHAI